MVPSCRLTRGPRLIRARSPRSTQPYQVLTPAASTTSPVSTAPGATELSLICRIARAPDSSPGVDCSIKLRRETRIFAARAVDSRLTPPTPRPGNAAGREGEALAAGVGSPGEWGG